MTKKALRLNNNQELYEYLTELHTDFIQHGAIELAGKIRHALGNAASMNTEFLGESRIALRAVLQSDDAGLTAARRIRMQEIIEQITAALEHRSKWSHLYVKAPSQSLEALTDLLTEACGIEKWERRLSDNYPKGTYYRVKVLGIEIQATYADSRKFPDYDFWLIFNISPPAVWDSSFLIVLVDRLARVLVTHVSEVARPLSWEKGDGRAVLYRATGGHRVESRTRRTFPELPDWSFEIAEVSASVYEVIGTSSSGKTVSAKGVNPDVLIENCKDKARALS